MATDYHYLSATRDPIFLSSEHRLYFLILRIVFCRYWYRRALLALQLRPLSIKDRDARRGWANGRARKEFGIGGRRIGGWAHDEGNVFIVWSGRNEVWVEFGSKYSLIFVWFCDIAARTKNYVWTHRKSLCQIWIVVVPYGNSTSPPIIH